MKRFLLIFIFLFPRPLHAGDVTEEWKRCPEVPLPTLDHHLGKITASIAAYSTLRLAGVNQTSSLVIVSGAGLLFEAIQFFFFDETLMHSLRDVVLFNYHLSIRGFENHPVDGVAVTVSLTSLYFLFSEAL